MHNVWNSGRDENEPVASYQGGVDRGEKNSQSKVKNRCLENMLLRFFSFFSANDGKLVWTLRMKLELRTFLYDIYHSDI